MTDISVCGLSGDKTITIGPGGYSVVGDTINYDTGATLYFPPGSNSGLTGLTIKPKYGATVNLGSTSNLSSLACPVTLNMTASAATVNLQGTVNFDSRVAVNTRPAATPGYIDPILNIGTNANAFRGTIIGVSMSDVMSSPLQFNGNHVAVNIKNTDTRLYINIPTYTEDGVIYPAAGISNTGLDFNDTSLTTANGNNIVFVVTQNVLNNVDFLNPNTFFQGGKDLLRYYDVLFTGNSVTAGHSVTPIDFTNLVPPTTRFIIENDVCFNFLNSTIAQSILVDVCLGYNLNIANGDIAASSGSQCVIMTGRGNVSYDSDVAFVPTGSGLVNIVSGGFGSGYGTMSGHPHVLMTPGNYGALGGNTHPYGIDPGYFYGGLTFDLSGDGTYELGTFDNSQSPNFDTDGTVTLSGGNFPNGVQLGGSGTVTITNSTIGGSTAQGIDGGNGHRYLIWSFDGPGTLNLTSSVSMKVPSNINFIYPSINTGTADYAAYAYNGSWTFNADIEHQTFFGKTTTLLTAGNYIFDNDSYAFTVKPEIAGITIRSSDIHAGITINTTDFSLNTANNRYYSQGGFNTPLTMTGSKPVIMSTSSPDTWYMNTPSTDTITYPFSGGPMYNYNYGVIRLNQGTYDFTNGSWYGMNTYLIDEGGNYVINNIYDGNGSDGLTLQTSTGEDTLSDVYLSLQATRGVHLAPRAGTNMHVQSSIIRSGSSSSDGSGAVMLGKLGLSGLGGQVIFDGESSTLAARNYAATIWDYTNGGVTYSAEVIPTLEYTAGGVYDFNASAGANSRSYHQLEYDSCLYLFNNGTFTFTNVGSALNVKVLNSLSATPTISGSFFAHGLTADLVDSNSALTLANSIFCYGAPNDTIHVTGQGTCTISTGITASMGVNNIESLLAVGGEGESCSLLIPNANPFTFQQGSHSYHYGITANTTGNVYLRGLVFPSAPGASHTTALWTNLYELTGQPFVSNLRYIAYSYDPTDTVQFYRAAGVIKMDDSDGADVSLYRFAVCDGDPSMGNGWVQGNLRVISSDLVNDTSASVLNAVYSGYYDSGYFGAFGVPGSGTQTHQFTTSINKALASFNLGLAANNYYLGSLESAVSFTHSGAYIDVSNFSYAIIDTVEPPSLTALGCNDTPDVSISPDGTGRVTVAINPPCCTPLYIFPYLASSDRATRTIDSVLYAGPSVTEEFIMFRDAANASHYIDVSTYIDQSTNSTHVQRIASGSDTLTFKLMGIESPIYFTDGVLPLVGYFTPYYSEGLVTIGDNTEGAPNLLYIHNTPNNKPYPRVSLDLGGWETIPTQTLYDTGEAAEQLGEFTKNSTYSSSYVTYDISFYIRSDLATTGAPHHITFTADSNYTYNLTTSDASVDVTETDPGIWDISFDGADTSGHLFNLSVRSGDPGNYQFNMMEDISFTLVDTSPLRDAIEVVPNETGYVSTYFTWPGVILVGSSQVGEIPDSSLDLMDFSGTLTYSINRNDSTRTQHVTIKTVGVVDTSLLYHMSTEPGDEHSHKFNNIIVDDSDNSGMNDITVSAGHSSSTAFTVPPRSLDCPFTISNGDSIVRTLTETWPSITGGAHTVSSVHYINESNDTRYLDASYGVGPQTDIGTVANTADTSDNWTFHEDTIVYPTSRIYSIGINASIPSVPYWVTGEDNAANASIAMYLTFTDQDDVSLNPGEDGFHVYRDSELSDPSLGNVTSITLDSDTYAGNAVYISVGAYTGTLSRLNVYATFSSADTDYGTLNGVTHKILSISYDQLPTGVVEGLVLSIGNWLIESDTNGNLLFKYSVVKEGGVNQVIGTYRLVPLTTTKNIVSAMP